MYKLLIVFISLLLITTIAHRTVPTVGENGCPVKKYSAVFKGSLPIYPTWASKSQVFTWGKEKLCNKFKVNFEEKALKHCYTTFDSDVAAVLSTSTLFDSIPSDQKLQNFDKLKTTYQECCTGSSTSLLFRCGRSTNSDTSIDAEDLAVNVNALRITKTLLLSQSLLPITNSKLPTCTISYTTGSFSHINNQVMRCRTSNQDLYYVYKISMLFQVLRKAYGHPTIDLFKRPETEATDILNQIKGKYGVIHLGIDDISAGAVIDLWDNDKLTIYNSNSLLTKAYRISLWETTRDDLLRADNKHNDELKLHAERKERAIPTDEKAVDEFATKGGDISQIDS